ncbi:MAG TPA: phospho-sugar mutase, partial [Microbacteriaceae bacterium]|nr:phospho-sugar mutase [Microbacteriaceae bacterium]
MTDERGSSSAEGAYRDPHSLNDRVEAWLEQDPDPQTRAELTELLQRADTDETARAELGARFSGRLAFGTAGLRAELGAGPMRMNRVVVAQAAAGLAAYLLSRPRAEEAEGSLETDERLSVVIGYDGRRNSDVFARDAAELMAGAGIRVRILPRALPTPVLAFSVRHLGASAGLMITASHNPPRDNGLKVYLGDADAGSQIVPPADAAIAAAIAQVAEGSVADLPRADDFEILTDAILEAYVAATAAVARPSTRSARSGTDNRGARSGTNDDNRSLSEGEARVEGSPTSRLRVAYTAMHGVGLETAQLVFAAAGLPPLLPVPEQSEPDGRFPTLVFPNPEEPGALDLSFAFATANDADLIVANDPDADRLAIAVPDPGEPDGWRRLTGNEVGLILGWDAAESAAAEAVTDGPRPTLANSLVSSPGLARIAAHWGLAHAETLTGFKWISRVPGLVYGYEEALGYLVNPGTVRDKDGISAAVRFVALAERWRAEGRTVDDALDSIAAAVGGYASGQVSIRVEDLADIARLMARLRATPPTAFAGIDV